MYYETKNFVRLTLLQYLLYCGGLELNPQYFLGMLVYAATQTEAENSMVNLKAST